MKIKELLWENKRFTKQTGVSVKILWYYGKTMILQYIKNEKLCNSGDK